MGLPSISSLSRDIALPKSLQTWGNSSRFLTLKEAFLSRSNLTIISLIIAARVLVGPAWLYHDTRVVIVGPRMTLLVPGETRWKMSYSAIFSSPGQSDSAAAGK